MPIAFIFPGQNSRYPGMIDKLIDAYPLNRQWIQRASDVLGRDLLAKYTSGNPHMFARNRDVQIGVFLANHLHWQNLDREGIDAEYSAGLSLGEYNHLVHIGALTFDDALRALDARGAAYERGPRGKMRAVFPVDPQDVEQLIDNLGLAGEVSLGMINSARQCVLSGTAAAVDRVAERVEDEFLAQSVVIDDQLPMHSSIFRPVETELREALLSLEWRLPSVPYLPNVTGMFLQNPRREQFVDLLCRHTWNTVLWRKSMELMCEVPDVTFVECGPKSVLTNFFGRKWLNPGRFFVDAEEGFVDSLRNLLKELTSAAGRTAEVR
jgi:[acyl-carrier-protein] S-malonyltransferase